MNMTTDDLMRAAEDLEIPEAYAMSIGEAKAVKDCADDMGMFDGIALSYYMGYIRGQKAQMEMEGAAK